VRTPVRVEYRRHSAGVRPAFTAPILPLGGGFLTALSRPCHIFRNHLALTGASLQAPGFRALRLENQHAPLRLSLNDHAMPGSVGSGPLNLAGFDGLATGPVHGDRFIQRPGFERNWAFISSTSA